MLKLINKVILGISGMTCANCVRRIEEGLNKTPGVLHANVNIAVGKAFLEYDTSIVDTNDLQNRIRDFGYEAFIEASESLHGPEQDNVTISIGVMTCAACVRRAENALKETKGMRDANANLVRTRATIIHDPAWEGLPASTWL
jgi:Cu+-exporting ATPase